MLKTQGTHTQRQRQQILAVKVSIVASLVLFFISAGVGIAVDSITLLLDAGAGLVILLVAFLMHASIKKIHQPPDDYFNFGYSKYEPLTVVVQGVLIIATCLISIKFAIQDIVHPEEVHSYLIPTLATFISGVIGIFVAIYIKISALRTNSAMLHTASLHWRADTVLSFGVCAGFFIGLMLQRSGFTSVTAYVDPIMAIILALFIILAPLKAILYNVKELLDAVPEASIYAKVRKVVDRHKPHSFGVYRLRVRKAGEKIFVDVCFIVHNEATVASIEELAINFERDLREDLPDSDVVVYFKPNR